MKIGSISGKHFNFPATSTDIEQVKSRFFPCPISILESKWFLFDSTVNPWNVMLFLRRAHSSCSPPNYTCFSVLNIHHLFIVNHFNASRKINKIPSNMTLTSNDSVKNPPSRAILPQSSKCVKGWNESQDSPLISSLFRQISLQTLAHRSMHCIISGPVNNPSLFTVHPIFNFLFPSC